ncbi:hypothetical protein KWG64_19670 [Rahnella sp. PD12R]|nr:hypothetical protein [Rahnella sp. PD12R]
MTYTSFSPKGITTSPAQSIPASQWLCMFDTDTYKNGYDTGSYPEKISFNKKTKLWEVRQTGISFKGSSTYVKLKLYNIQSPNSSGFAVVDENINKHDQVLYRDKDLKKLIHFCMIHDIYALCGTGNLTTRINNKDVDLTSNALKSLETIRLKNQIH